MPINLKRTGTFNSFMAYTWVYPLVFAAIWLYLSMGEIKFSIIEANPTEIALLLVYFSLPIFISYMFLVGGIYNMRLLPFRVYKRGFSLSWTSPLNGFFSRECVVPREQIARIAIDRRYGKAMFRLDYLDESGNEKSLVPSNETLDDSIGALKALYQLAGDKFTEEAKTYVDGNPSRTDDPLIQESTTIGGNAHRSVRQERRLVGLDSPMKVLRKKFRPQFLDRNRAEGERPSEGLGMALPYFASIALFLLLILVLVGEDLDIDALIMAVFYICANAFIVLFIRNFTYSFHYKGLMDESIRVDDNGIWIHIRRDVRLILRLKGPIRFSDIVWARRYGSPYTLDTVRYEIIMANGRREDISEHLFHSLSQRPEFRWNGDSFYNPNHSSLPPRALAGKSEGFALVLGFPCASALFIYIWGVYILGPLLGPEMVERLGFPRIGLTFTILASSFIYVFVVLTSIRIITFFNRRKMSEGVIIHQSFIRIPEAPRRLREIHDKDIQSISIVKDPLGGNRLSINTTRGAIGLFSSFEKELSSAGYRVDRRTN